MRREEKGRLFFPHPRERRRPVTTVVRTDSAMPFPPNETHTRSKPTLRLQTYECGPRCLLPRSSRTVLRRQSLDDDVNGASPECLAGQPARKLRDARWTRSPCLAEFGNNSMHPKQVTPPPPLPFHPFLKDAPPPVAARSDVKIRGRR